MKSRNTFANSNSTPRATLVRGFTLLELLVVVAIIGLLAAYVGPRYFSQVERSETTAATAQIEAFARALDHYRLDVGRYPSSEQGLEALLTRPGGESRWNGPYLQKSVPLDPWGRAYQYRSPGQDSDYDLYTLGRDGQRSALQATAHRE